MKKHESRRQRHRKKRRYLKWTLKTVWWALALLFILSACGAGIGVGIVSAMVKDEPVRSKADFQRDLDSLFQNSYAYFQNTDKNNNPVRIGAFRNDGEYRKLIRSVNDVSPYLVDAFIATEDRDFYTHHGIVPRSILRAAYQQLVHADVTTGGSTITQQLVKNVILKNREQDLERKSKEIVLAVRLDAMFSKNQILVYYMNSVFFGKGANRQNLYGVQAAAKGLFNVDAKELNLPQAAYIAGMVQRPNDYNPFRGEKNLQHGIKRMQLVLRNMLETGKITPQQYHEALKFNIKASLAKPDPSANGYSSYPFIMYALETETAEILMQHDGLNIEELSKQGKYRSTLEQYVKQVQTRGYHVYSTIDQKMYDAVNKAATKNLTFHNRTYKGIKGHEQLGAVIIDNRSGAILAFVPGTSSYNQNAKNHALDASRQSGSTIKPLLVYGPAIEEKVISPDTLVLDEKIPRADGSGYYENSGKTYHGPVTVKEALKWSYNIPAIKVFNRLGHDTGFSYLRKLGIPPDPIDGEAAAIGGQTRGYTVAKMTAAFATFANQGNYNSPYLISKVTDANGHVIWEHKQAPTRIFSPQTSYQITDMLRDVVKSGTGVFIGSRIHGYDLAGKTGTSTDDRDLWFIGYTPQVTIGAWSGYDYGFSMSHNDHFTKRAWVNIFNAAAKSSPSYFDKGARFENPGHLFDGVKCLECDKIKKYQDKKKKEQKNNRDQHNNQPPDLPPALPPSVPPPPNNGDNPPPTEPSEPPTKPWYPPPPDEGKKKPHHDPFPF
ncbi:MULTISPECIES: transglycosylase domain-containing protein [unclassified Thermoactinomyces]|jgi:penicillin-binding protein 1B|uniref:transglycosylase domain-containing protein n=1 Tax=unclassified Thermoactinomyces TaxID=2634588 RepID=UPI0018DD0887|nr:MULTISPECIES: transglycosylase domain-containing protein [unclassified Thermoactinomyces]MBH8597126.1 penicillin-binding protein [Thermoactinomyces sp. CICC 10523]MBH8606203.1 penicillin-binding protein [Thermoactinomyces sp. CICC 10521]